jgi:hypothetical protein
LLALHATHRARCATEGRSRAAGRRRRPRRPCERQMDIACQHVQAGRDSEYGDLTTSARRAAAAASGGAAAHCADLVSPRERRRKSAQPRTLAAARASWLLPRRRARGAAGGGRRRGAPALAQRSRRAPARKAATPRLRREATAAARRRGRGAPSRAATTASESRRETQPPAGAHTKWHAAISSTQRMARIGRVRAPRSACRSESRGRRRAWQQASGASSSRRAGQGFAPAQQNHGLAAANRRVSALLRGDLARARRRSGARRGETRVVPFGWSARADVAAESSLLRSSSVSTRAARASKVRQLCRGSAALARGPSQLR